MLRNKNFVTRKTVGDLFSVQYTSVRAINVELPMEKGMCNI
eukprot:SAG11_NODE_92_length_17132_cov_10.277285_21_plen_41_part_00